MRFIVYGAGGIGAAMGAFLHESGQESVLIARGEHLRRIQAEGLTLITGEGRSVVRVPAVGHPGELEPRPDDVVLLTMKAQDTELALRDLRDTVGDPWNTPVFCVQNCLANERMAARYFAHVYGVMIVIPGVYLEPGVVFNPIAGNHGYMDVGCYPSGIDSRVEMFVEAVRRAGYAANPHPDVLGPKAAKFLGNLENAMGAITDGRGDSGPYMAEARREAIECLRAAGHPLEDHESYAARRKAHRGTDVELPETRGNRGSSWQSLKRGQGTIEVDFLNGEVVLLGRLHGIPTPFNAVLQRVANSMARNRQQPGLYAAEDLWQMATAQGTA